jgi:hypothetical protein
LLLTISFKITMTIFFKKIRPKAMVHEAIESFSKIHCVVQ